MTRLDVVGDFNKIFLGGTFAHISGDGGGKKLFPGNESKAIA